MAQTAPSGLQSAAHAHAVIISQLRHGRSRTAAHAHGRPRYNLMQAYALQELPCGHFMHSSCFAAYTQHRYTCPVCLKSVGDLTLYFQMLDRLLLNEQLPPELAAKEQRIHCNDCSRGAAVPYHFVYHKCPGCGSYNTRVQ